jgi:hypothetical protein
MKFALILLAGIGLVSEAQILGPGFQIVKAEYGADSRWTDLTSRLRSLVRGNGVEFRVDPETLGDPLPGVQKTLRVRYVFRGQTRTENFVDMASVRLGDPGRAGSVGGSIFGGNSRPGRGALEIVKAEYGEGTRWRDVTTLVSQQVNGNAVRMDVTNSTMGGDPAPAVVKSLRVDYSYQDQRRTVTVSENAQLILPEGNVPVLLPEVSGQLVILTAEYRARGRSINVTDLMRGAIRGDQLKLRVENGTMGGDPYAGADKELYVRYTYQGREYENFSREGSTVAIPNRYDRARDGNRRSNPQ